MSVLLFFNFESLVRSKTRDGFRPFLCLQCVLEKEGWREGGRGGERALNSCSRLEDPERALI